MSSRTFVTHSGAKLLQVSASSSAQNPRVSLTGDPHDTRNNSQSPQVCSEYRKIHWSGSVDRTSKHKVLRVGSKQNSPLPLALALPLPLPLVLPLPLRPLPLIPLPLRPLPLIPLPLRPLPLIPLPLIPLPLMPLPLIPLPLIPLPLIPLPLRPLPLIPLPLRPLPLIPLPLIPLPLIPLPLIPLPLRPLPLIPLPLIPLPLRPLPLIPLPLRPLPLIPLPLIPLPLRPLPLIPLALPLPLRPLPLIPLPLPLIPLPLIPLPLPLPLRPLPLALPLPLPSGHTPESSSSGRTGGKNSGGCAAAGLRYTNSATTTATQSTAWPFIVRVLNVRMTGCRARPQRREQSQRGDELETRCSTVRSLLLLAFAVLLQALVVRLTHTQPATLQSILVLRLEDVRLVASREVY